MKDEFITVGIFALLIFLFVWNSVAVNLKTDKMTELILALEEKEEMSSEDAARLKDTWDKEQKILLYFIPHEITKQIDECMMFMCEYAAEGDRPMADHFLKKARSLLKELVNREKISLDNIF